MATRTVKKIEREIAILKDKIANLVDRLEKIQSKCSHQYERRKISNTMETCDRCHEEIMIPPTTSRFPIGAHNW
ncbi:MAG: hypothetical protein HYT61_03285 [Candidatus Yanofskybacteria bacterium]|nr:hypothetical protein [Candidatus Yanofskybacteria bacterium]